MDFCAINIAGITAVAVIFQHEACKALQFRDVVVRHLVSRLRLHRMRGQHVKQTVCGLDILRPAPTQACLGALDLVAFVVGE
ncbi:hypothetical protein DIE09_06375 [Burkholderia sp. Bp9010]|nr:hypothetical protein DIE10_06195 [Burkholderia sp. Bp9011]RQR97022.1 hypothetical protein DIE09_06375 [Burkholderia sp. Bp9010]